MRNYCLDCTIKHLAQAYVLNEEVIQGYPDHILGVIGHLAEASEECREVSKELASEIREYRIQIHNKIIDVVENGDFVKIPFFDLMKKVIVLIKEYGCGNCTKSQELFKKRLKERKEQDEQ